MATAFQHFFQITGVFSYQRPAGFYFVGTVPQNEIWKIMLLRYDGVPGGGESYLATNHTSTNPGNTNNHLFRQYAITTPIPVSTFNNGTGISNFRDSNVSGDFFPLENVYLYNSGANTQLTYYRIIKYRNTNY